MPLSDKQKKLFISTGIGVSKSLLIALFAGAVVIAPGGVAGTVQVFNKLFDGEDGYDEKQLKRSLYYLQSKKLIHIQKQYDKEAYTLTKIGWLKARKLSNSFAVKRPERWDGKWRMVIFDIPVHKKGEAEIFRRDLRYLGLANVQKSIWVYPYDCKDQVFYLAEKLKIEPSIRFIVADSITGEKDLCQRFGVKF